MDFVPDDYVVHVEHGIGKFTGTLMLNAAGSDKEYLVLQYGGNDVLYVPTDQIDRVSRYVGAGDHVPVLNRLGTQEWIKTRQKAKEAAELLARDLLVLYAAREVVPGHAFPHDTVWQQEMEAAFPYVETPDQLEAQKDVKEDMEKPKPMDRLVCGDVGYGKTEVAIRAAFKAVMDGRQVAVLVPTTILAQQHFETFTERLEAFPVKVEVLSRFRSDREQRDVVNGLAEGTVDICIGTHRLIQNPDIIGPGIARAPKPDQHPGKIGQPAHKQRDHRQYIMIRSSTCRPCSEASTGRPRILCSRRCAWMLMKAEGRNPKAEGRNEGGGW